MELAEASAGPPFDAVVIGGGINGAGIAREAARRGLRVALFEADDFGFGTTWRSTKLIHGGLRYLEHGDFRLVFESLRERKWLLRTRPHLVHPQRLLFPMLSWTRLPAWQARLGLIAYDLMAMDSGVPRHRWLTREAMAGRAPFLDPGHDGGFAFFDARARSPERLALELACEARDFGALVLNHARVTRVLSPGGAVHGVAVEHDGKEHEVPARAVINAAGPWVDAVNRAAGIAAPPLQSLTRGTHIVLDVDYPIREAVFSMAKSDGRVFFAVPQDGLLLVGTTDIRESGDPGSVRPTRAEVDYLLAEARSVLPGLDIGRCHVRYAYAGVRPLQRSTRREEAISRRHRVVRHEERGGPTGLYSITGGKLSTFRQMADDISGLLGAGRLPEDPPENQGAWRELLREAPLDPKTRSRLRNYGPALERILGGPPNLLSVEPAVLQAEVAHAVHNEMAVTLEDVLLRRTGLGWTRNRGLDCHQAVANAMAKLLGWNEAETAKQVRRYEAAVRFHLPAMEDLEDDERATTGD